MWYMRGEHGNEEGGLNWAHPFPRFWDVTEGVILQRVRFQRLGFTIIKLEEEDILIMETLWLRVNERVAN